MTEKDKSKFKKELEVASLSAAARKEQELKHANNLVKLNTEMKKQFNYTKEELDFITTNIKPTSNICICKPNIITHESKDMVVLSEPEVTPIVDILAVGPECKVLSPGMKASLNFPSLGSVAMFKTKINNKDYLCLMETQLFFGFSSELEIKEEKAPDNPELKPDDGMAYTNEKMTKSGIILN